jgi:hypothetical protein
MKLAASALLAALALASFQSYSALRAPHVVAALRVPGGEAILLRAFADGVQVYECGRGEAGLGWVLKGPEANLVDDRAQPIGKHYAGPTWEALDGSRVVGSVVASVDAGDPSAIPHLLLKAKERAGEGIFANVRSIQRLQTAGGRAPREACLVKDLGRVVRVRYSATYYFYGEKPNVL